MQFRFIRNIVEDTVLVLGLDDVVGDFIIFGRELLDISLVVQLLEDRLPQDFHTISVQSFGLFCLDLLQYSIIFQISGIILVEQMNTSKFVLLDLLQQILLILDSLFTSYNLALLLFLSTAVLDCISLRDSMVLFEQYGDERVIIFVDCFDELVYMMNVRLLEYFFEHTEMIVAISCGHLYLII